MAKAKFMRKRRTVRKAPRRFRSFRPGRQMIVNRALQPVPQRFICKMKYSELFSTGLVTGTYAYNLNSIFDPNRTGIGHQPYGHDTMQTLYNRYRVISCSWRIARNINSGENSCQIGAIPANELLSWPGGIDELKENPRAKYVLQNPGAKIEILSGKSYIPSLVGRNKSQYMADDRYQAVMGTSPAELAILNIATYSGFVNEPTSVALNIVLEYTVEFFDIKNLAQS